MNAIAGRVVVIAGASSASGHAIARALTTARVRVVAVGSNAARLADVAAEATYECDLTDPTAVTDLATRVRGDFGRVDGLVHLVGGWRPGHDNDDWRWLSSHLIDTLRHTSIAFRDDLSASDAGRLAIVGSASADTPTWGNANYATAKAAADAWVAALASGWKKAGTAAAVTLVVRSLGDGDGDTPVESLAHAVVGLWDAPADQLNGARISLAD